MAIDSNFEQNREKVGEEDGVAVWGPVEPPEKQGIRGTHVAVDFDICLADGACLEDCPVDVFESGSTPQVTPSRSGRRAPSTKTSVSTACSASSTSARSTRSTSIPAAKIGSDRSFLYKSFFWR